MTDPIPGTSDLPDPDSDLPDEPHRPGFTHLPIQLSVHRRSSRIVLTFSHPCSEFTLSPASARSLADQLHILAVESEFRNR